MTKTSKKSAPSIGCTLGCAVVGFFILLVILPAFMVLFEVPFFMVFGWIPYVRRISNEVEVSTTGCVLAAIVLVMLVVVSHLFFRWFFKALQRRKCSESDQPIRAWRLHWTLSSVAITLLLFVSAIALLSIVHQVNWIVRSPVAMTGGSLHQSGRMAASRNNLHMIGRAIYRYEAENGNLPSSIKTDIYGRYLHGWSTQLLPILEEPTAYKACKFDRPWDSTENARTMKTYIPILINPALREAPHQTENSYWLTHYATNSRVIGPGPAMSLDEITDGLSTTILLGEINHDFLPWGHPRNYRDPAIGLNVPGGFGGTDEQYTQFLFCDGSVKRIRNDIDPVVLRALATPAAGDDPGDEKDWIWHYREKQ